MAILRASDFGVAATAVTQANGIYSATLPAGTYYLYLADVTGAHGFGLWGAPTATPVVVAAAHGVPESVVWGSGQRGFGRRPWGAVARFRERPLTWDSALRPPLTAVITVL